MLVSPCSGCLVAELPPLVQVQCLTLTRNRPALRREKSSRRRSELRSPRSRSSSTRSDSVCPNDEELTTEPTKLQKLLIIINETPCSKRDRLGILMIVFWLLSSERCFFNDKKKRRTKTCRNRTEDIVGESDVCVYTSGNDGGEFVDDTLDTS